MAFLGEQKSIKEVAGVGNGPISRPKMMRFQPARRNSPVLMPRIARHDGV